MYVEVLRGTPLLLQLYFVFLSCSRVFPVLDLTPLSAGIIGLAINYSAYEAENYRAGLLAIPKGQMEAALAPGHVAVHGAAAVIVPQAVRIVIPPVTNDFIALFKDTSVCSVILITELTRKYNELYNFNRELHRRARVRHGRAVPADELPAVAPRALAGTAHGHARGERPPMIRVSQSS